MSSAPGTSAPGTSAPSASASKRAAALPPQERRAAIVEAVIPLLVEHGEQVTTKQIAEAAGIAEGTIFRAFTDKEELFHAALDKVLDQTTFEQAIGEIDPDQPLAARLVAATDVIQRRVVELWTILSRLGAAARHRAGHPMTDSPELAALFESASEQIRIEPAAAARMLRALTLSLTHPMIVGEPATAEEIVAVVLHGIERR